MNVTPPPQIVNYILLHLSLTASSRQDNNLLNSNWKGIGHPEIVCRLTLRGGYFMQNCRNTIIGNTNWHMQNWYCLLFILGYSYLRTIRYFLMWASSLVQSDSIDGSFCPGEVSHGRNNLCGFSLSYYAWYLLIDTIISKIH